MQGWIGRIKIEEGLHIIVAKALNASQRFLIRNLVPRGVVDIDLVRQRQLILRREVVDRGGDLRVRPQLLDVLDALQYSIVDGLDVVPAKLLISVDTLVK